MLIRKLVSILLLLLCFASPAMAENAKGLDGVDDAYVVADINKPNASTYSVCAWIKPSTPPGPSNVVLFRYGRGTSGSAGTGWQIELKPDMTIRWDSFDAGTNFQSSGSATLTAGSWQHVCFVRESLFQHKIYISATDATADEALAVDPGAVQTSTDDFAVAKPVPDDSSALGFGQIEINHVVYYDAALSGAEVASLADKSTCPTAVATHSANLQVFLKGTEAGAVLDSSSNTFTVTTDGAPSTTTGTGGLPCGSGGGVNDDVLIILHGTGEL